MRKMHPHDKWKKYVNNNEHFYYLPEKSDKAEFKLMKQVDPAELEVEINKCKSNPHVIKLHDSLVAVRHEREQADDRLVELPYGHYYHRGGNYPLPERLEKITLREERYFLNQNLFDYVKSDIKGFLESEHVYKEMETIYKRGYLFYGPPGNGKTGFIRHMVKHILPEECHVIWLHGLPDLPMIKAFNAINTLKVFIVEEVTTKRHDPDYTKELLEFLDGELSTNNSIVIATTNYPESLEQNLADRKGRFDVCLEIPEPDEDECKTFFEQFLGRPLEENEVPLKKLSVAHIKEICIVHKIFNKPLKECYDDTMDGRKKFKNGFVKREKMGM